MSGLLQGLMNPSFGRQAGNLGLSLGQSLAGVPQREAELIRQGRDGKEAIFNMLQTADATDPNVLNAASQVADKYNVMPEELAELVEAAQLQQNRQEQNRLAEERNEISARNAAATEALRSIQTEQAARQNKQLMITSQVNNLIDDAEGLQKMYDRLSEEDRGFAKGVARQIRQAQAQIDEITAANTPVSEAELESIGKVVDPSSIERYNAAVAAAETGAAVGAAKRVLAEDYRQTFQRKLITDSANDERVREPTATQYQQALDYVEKADGYWFGIAGDADIADSDREAVAWALARDAINEKKYQWTPEGVEQALADLESGSDMAAWINAFTAAEREVLIAEYGSMEAAWAKKQGNK